MKKKDNEFGGLIWYYPICALFLLGLGAIWNPMNQAKCINFIAFIALLGGFILLLVILFRKEKKDKHYNMVSAVVNFAIFILVEVTLITKLGEIAKEVNPLVVGLSFIIQLSIMFYCVLSRI